MVFLHQMHHPLIAKYWQAKAGVSKNQRGKSSRRINYFSDVASVVMLRKHEHDDVLTPLLF